MAGFMSWDRLNNHDDVKHRLFENCQKNLLNLDRFPNTVNSFANSGIQLHGNRVLTFLVASSGSRVQKRALRNEKVRNFVRQNEDTITSKCLPFSTI